MLRAAPLIAMIAVMTVASPAARAADLALPSASTARFLGVETCGSSECHGSAEPWRNATVMMKERQIWQAHDAHAKAYTALTGKDGQAIGHKMGLADPAQAEQCLVCHTTFVPAAQRGPKFSLEAGVGCESCHGAGGSFVPTHIQPTSKHATNIAAGMYPTNNPGARAALCLSCHQGDAVRKVSHQLYGAGHPRLRFELDTFSVLQPYHFNPDADYRRRKPPASHFRLWAEGQIGAANQLLAQLSAENAAPHGLFPELSRFDCHACHRGINNDPNYQPRPGLRAGSLTLNDAPLIALRALAKVVAPTQVAALEKATRELQNSVADPVAHRRATERLKDIADQLATDLRARAEQAGDGQAVASALLATSRAEAPLPFMTAEGVAMALATLSAADFENQRVSAAQYQKVNTALDAAYAALGDEQTYRPTVFAQALTAVATALGQ